MQREMGADGSQPCPLEGILAERRTWQLMRLLLLSSLHAWLQESHFHLDTDLYRPCPERFAKGLHIVWKKRTNAQYGLQLYLDFFFFLHSRQWLLALPDIRITFRFAPRIFSMPYQTLVAFPPYDTNWTRKVPYLAV